MAYLSSIWAVANNSVNDTALKGLYKYTNDTLDGVKLETGNAPWAICVATNKSDVYVVNQDDATVSRYQSGERMKDISTGGSTPYGVCQGIIPDSNGNYPIFVTNYATNTVSKIVNDSVQEVIPVGTGPRGICVDRGGNIWVANYTSNDVSVIWKGVTVYNKTIKVATGPDGICSDTKGNIYVACSVSGVVSKISNQIKVADINVGSAPRGICTDDNNNIWVSNFNSRTVTKINGADLSTTDFPAGSGPLSIGLRKNPATNSTDIAVFNYTDKTIMRLDIRTGTELGTIETGYNPMGFGDFTGMQTYLMRLQYDGQNPGGVTKTGWDDLSDDLQKIILGQIDPGITHKASDIILSGHPDYPTVQAALDEILYVDPVVGSFNITNPINAIAEVGSKINTVNFAWTATNLDNIVSQTILCASNDKASVGSVAPGIMSAVLNDTTNTLNLQTNTTWTLTVRTKKGDITRSALLKFLPKMYYGVTKKAVYTSAEITALSNNEFIEADENNSISKTMKFDATGGNYLVFAVPSAFRMNAGGDITIGGFINSDWDVKQDFSITNASGYTNKYDIYTSKNIQTDENLVVVITYTGGNSNSTDINNSANNTQG
jgi:streptogramin lyase